MKKPTLNGKPAITVEATPQMAADYAAAVSRGEFAGRVLDLARASRGLPPEEWPACSTDERLAVAMALNNAEAVRAIGFTMLGAMDRVRSRIGACEMDAILKALFLGAGVPPIRGRAPILIEPYTNASREERTRRADFASQVLYMARLAKGVPMRAWPDWTRDEKMAVAVVLNDHAALNELDLHMIEAVTRVGVGMGRLELAAVLAALCDRLGRTTKPQASSR